MDQDEYMLPENHHFITVDQDEYMFAESHHFITVDQDEYMLPESPHCITVDQDLYMLAESHHFISVDQDEHMLPESHHFITVDRRKLKKHFCLFCSWCVSLRNNNFFPTYMTASKRKLGTYPQPSSSPPSLRPCYSCSLLDWVFKGKWVLIRWQWLFIEHEMLELLLWSHVSLIYLTWGSKVELKMIRHTMKLASISGHL